MVAKNEREACDAVDEILTDKKFGDAGETVVIEELLFGEEVSVYIYSAKLLNFISYKMNYS